MRKSFGKLPKREQEKIEAKYHKMNPRDFDGTMSRARRHSPAVIRLSPTLVQKLKRLARAEGESEYEVMVRRWVEERLQRETSSVD